jgi:hypothetical protein
LFQSYHTIENSNLNKGYNVSIQLLDAFSHHDKDLCNQLRSEIGSTFSLNVVSKMKATDPTHYKDRLKRLMHQITRSIEFEEYLLTTLDHQLTAFRDQNMKSASIITLSQDSENRKCRFIFKQTSTLPKDVTVALHFDQHLSTVLGSPKSKLRIGPISTSDDTLSTHIGPQISSTIVTESQRPATGINILPRQLHLLTDIIKGFSQHQNPRLKDGNLTSVLCIPEEGIDLKLDFVTRLFNQTETFYSVYDFKNILDTINIEFTNEFFQPVFFAMYTEVNFTLKFRTCE